MTCGIRPETNIEEKLKFTAMESHVRKLPRTHQKVMRLQPQPRESSNLENKIVPFLRDSFLTYGRHMKRYFKRVLTPWWRDMDFLLKIHEKNHKPKVDGNASACASTHQHANHYYDAMCQTSNRGYWERKHTRSKKAKNSYFGYLRVRINTDASEEKSRNTTKSVVSRNERLVKYYDTLVKYPGHPATEDLP
jgi:hypothetical protein